MSVRRLGWLNVIQMWLRRPGSCSSGTLAGAGISALLALILAGPAGRLRAATSAAS
ncbi:MAG TPA: hypothetical protein VI006_02415 [Solirubrobacteraceae bacterium]